jgi:hypothetical protein
LWKNVYPIETGIFERNFGILVEDLLHHNQENGNNFSRIVSVIIRSKVECWPVTWQVEIKERQKYSATNIRRRRCKDGVVSPLSGRIPSGKDRVSTVQKAEWA